MTVYEHFHKAGGVLAYGIPEFRLPKAIVQKEIDKLVAMGVNIVCDATIGKCMSIDELLGKDADHLLGDDTSCTLTTSATTPRSCPST